MRPTVLEPVAIEAPFDGGQGMLPKPKVRLAVGRGPLTGSPRSGVSGVEGVVGERGGSPSPTYFRVGSGAECDPSWETWECIRDGTQVKRRARCADERRCPACSITWAWREGHTAENRLQAARGERYEPRHVVVSIPPTSLVEDRHAIIKMKQKSRKILEEMGFRGGLMVVHLWRHERQDSGCGPTQWWWGPHVHCIGYGWVDADKRPRDVYVEALRDHQATIAGTVAYLVDHCAVEPRGHAVTWFGTMSYNKLGRVAGPENEGVRCPQCGGVMVRTDEPVREQARRLIKRGPPRLDWEARYA